MTNSDFWQIKVVRMEHISKNIRTFIQSGFLTNKSRPNPTFTIGQKSWLDKNAVSDHFYWSKINIALAKSRKTCEFCQYQTYVPNNYDHDIKNSDLTFILNTFFFQWSEQFEANEKTDRFSLFFRMRMPIFQKTTLGTTASKDRIKHLPQIEFRHDWF